MSDRAQPGLFIAQRPRLAITLTLAVLALAGFSGSALLSSDTLGHALARLEVVFKVSLLVGALLIVPTLAPNSQATRTVLAALIAIAGGLFAWIAGPVLVGSAAFLPNAAIVVIGFTVAALVLAQPVTGRLLPVLVVCAPVLGLAGLAAVAGYLVRADLPQEPVTLLVLTLGFCMALLVGAVFSEGYARAAARGDVGPRLAASIAANQLLREVAFWLLAAALIFGIYATTALPPALEISWLWISVSIITAVTFPAIIIATALSSLTVSTRPVGWSLSQARARAEDSLAELLKKFRPPRLMAGFAILAILAAASVSEGGGGSATPAGAGIGGQALFYGLLLVLTALMFLSLRMGVLVAVTMLVSDTLAAGVLSLLAAGTVEPGAISDVIPRYLALILMIQFARNWADTLHERQHRRYKIRYTLAASAAPVILGLAACLLACSGLVIFAPDLGAEAGYMAVRLLVQMGIVMILLPAAISVLGNLKYTL